MSQYIKEIEIYLRDKKLDSLMAVAETRMNSRENPDVQWPEHRFLELGDGMPDMVPLTSFRSVLRDIRSYYIFEIAN